MAKPLSMDIRDRATARPDTGETVRAAGEPPRIAPSSVVTWSQHLRASESVSPGKLGGCTCP